MQINRLFGIIYILLDKKLVTAKELAERFEVSGRTIYRDIELLSQYGIPIYTNKGKGGGISLLDNFVLDKSLISDKEQTAILTSLMAMAAIPEIEKTGIGRKLSELFNKNNETWINVDFSEWGVSQKELFEQLRSAIIEKYIIEIDYINSRGETSRRLVEPLQLWFKNRAWYLIAYCRKAEDYRLFRLTRIRDIQNGREHFQRDLPDCKYEKANIKSTEIVLRINPEMEHRVYDEFQNFERDKDGYFIVTMNYFEDEWLYGYIMSFGQYAKVLKPLRVQKLIKQRFENSIKNYL